MRKYYSNLFPPLYHPESLHSHSSYPLGYFTPPPKPVLSNQSLKDKMIPPPPLIVKEMIPPAPPAPKQFVYIYQMYGYQSFYVMVPLMCLILRFL